MGAGFYRPFDKWNELDTDIIVGIPWRLVTIFVGGEPTEEEVTAVLRSVAKAKAAGPYTLLAELLKIGL